MGIDENDINVMLARNLRQQMEMKYGNVNQSELARDASVAQKTISNILARERGPAPSPSLTVVQKLAEALGIEAWQLLHPDPDRAEREQEFYRRIEKDFSNLVSESDRDQFGGVAVGKKKSKATNGSK